MADDTQDRLLSSREFLILRNFKEWTQGGAITLENASYKICVRIRGVQGSDHARRILNDFVSKRILSISPDGTKVKWTDYGLALLEEFIAEQEAWESLPVIPLGEADEKQIYIKPGEVFRAKYFLLEIFRKSKQALWLQDRYVSSELLKWLYGISPAVQVWILTSARALTQDPLFDVAYKAYRAERSVELRLSNAFHDRRVVIDKKEAHQFGESFKDVGHKGTVITRLEDVASAVMEFETLWGGAGVYSG